MTEKNSEIFKLLLKLFNKFKKSRQRQIIVLFFLILLSAFAELVSLLSVFPFLELISKSGSINEINFLKNLFYILGLSTENNVFLAVTVIFSLTAIISAIIKTLNLWYGNRLSASLGTDLSCECFRRNIYQEYLQFIGNNSSKLIANNSIYINEVTDALGIAARFFTALILSIFISLFLLLFNFFTSLFAIIIFLLTYFLIAKFSKGKLSRNSYLITNNARKQVQLMKETNGSFRDVILGSNQKEYLDFYKKLDYQKRISQAQNNFIYLFPRNSIESLLLVFLALLTYLISINSSTASLVIPTVGTLAVGAQKLLPYMQQAYGSWSSLIGSSASIMHVLQMLDIPIKDVSYKNKNHKIILKNYISAEGLSLKYENKNPYVFEDINFKINKGEIFGIVGKSGSGKSSLADILMGLIKPTNGFLKVDGINIYDENYPSRYIEWRNSITHVPQNIFLIDSTILENIAFTNKKNHIDFGKAIKAAKDANIHSFISQLPNGYMTIVGEDGVKLSGGQRQRIGIARALYKDCEILFFDEATSSLDIATENKILQTIFNLRGKKTIFIISHRLNSLKKCDRLIQFS